MAYLIRGATCRAAAILIAVALAELGGGGTSQAQRAKSPADATVFIRLIGSVQAAVEGSFETKRWDQVEIGTGSGFVISQFGYVLTNHHVVSSDELLLNVQGKRVKVVLKVSRIEVCFPADASAAQALASPCAEASVSATDPVLDLAVLLVSAPGLPYVPLGDSDASRVGLSVSAIGFPFGRKLNLGQATASDIVPEVSINGGTMSAVRAGDDGERRLLQISSNLNPGNSGGPVVDPDGYAVGVVRMKLTGGDGIGFAVPINQVKDFLESRGLAHMLPARRLRLGPLQSFYGKGIRVRVPDGFNDTSPFRTHVETEAKPGDIVLRIDRVFSPLSAQQLERALVTTDAFERLSIATSENELTSQPDGGRLLLGHATGRTADDKHEIRMESAVLDLGAEKIVARYVGPAEQMAFNESTLRASLAGLAGDRLLATEPESIEKLQWSAVSQSPLPVPVGWVLEPGAPTRCAGLPPASATLSTFSAGDFTVVLRAAVWPAGEVALDKAASACSARRGALDGASYAAAVDWLGVPYAIEGILTRVDSRHVQLEVLAPATKSAFARALLAAALKKATE